MTSAHDDIGAGIIAATRRMNVTKGRAAVVSRVYQDEREADPVIPAASRHKIEDKKNWQEEDDEMKQETLRGLKR